VFEIGGSLREARERRGLSLDEAQARTLVRSRYLRALEDERFELLPGDFYIRIFLREYAEYLGLDGDVYVEEYLAQHPPQPEPLPAPRRSLRPRRIGIGKPAAVLAAAVVTVLAAWNLTESSPTRQNLGLQSAVTPPTTQATPTAPPPAAKPARRASSIALSAARGPCWILVRVGAANGPVAYQKTLQPGETARFGLRKRLWIRLGAPWNVDATIGGRPADSLPARTGDVVASASGLSPA
jgi:cytoskeleton protein RodZ